MKKLLFSGLLFSLAGLALAAPAGPSITQADKPVRLIRGSSLFKAGVGVVVQKDDIVETAQAGAQLELGHDVLIVLAPETSLYLGAVPGDAQPHTDIVLLAGWVKVLSKSRVAIVTPGMRVSFEGGSAIVHGAVDKVEMFAEEGAQTVNQMDPHGKPGADIKVAREQYAFGAGQVVKVLPRPAKDFLGGMPPNFRDSVAPMPDRLKGAHPQPVKDNEVDFADVEGWLSSDLALKQNLAGRFAVRLKDPAFRQKLDAKLGQSPEWKLRLHPPKEKATGQY